MILSWTSYRFTLKWTRFLNGLLFKIIYFSCNLQYCHKSHTLASTWTQLLNELVIKIIHFSCNLQWCPKLCTQTSSGLNYWVNSLSYKLFIPYVIFNVLTSYIDSLWSKLYSWIDSSWKLFTSQLILNVLTNCIHSIRSETNSLMNS